MAFEMFGALGIASIIGMVFRFLTLTLGGVGKIVRLVAGLVVAVVVAILAFSPFFSGLTLNLITGNVFLAFIVFLGLGYAVADIIMGLFK